MNRLQKKCLIATAGFHLLLVLILVFGSAFFTSHPKLDDTQVLDVIPANLIDAAFNSGVKAAQPSAPTPVVQPQPPAPQPQPQPTPPQPQAVVTPPPPTPSLVKQVEDFFKPVPEKLPPDDLKPVDDSEKTSKPQPHKIQVDLKPVVHNVSKVTDTSDTDAREAAKEAKRRAKAIAQAARAIKENYSTATEINMPGNSSVAYANYGAAVVSAYHQAWIAPDNMASATAVVRFSVTIARDGHVISSSIVTSSGDASVDNAVQRMLDRVSYIGEFPEDSKDQQRTYNIDFNATRTSTL
jgi:TonB family protein